MDARLLHILLTLQQVGGYTYRNQRKFSEDIDWSYTAGTLNQHNWAKKFPACGNAKQSPIDVEESLAQVKLEYQNLRLDGWENVTGRRSAIKNDGKTVAVDVDGDFYVSGGGLGSTFKAGRITFHWGRCNASSEGSEHSLDGVKYPLEMQIYCYQPQRFESFDRTVEAGGPIAALAVLFEASSEEEDNADFAPIADAVDGVSRYGKSGRVAPFAPRGLLPDSTDKYFVYNGSLTTPPCSETVEWIVFKNTVRISARQLEVFCEVMTMEQAGYVMLMDYLQNNYRERQRQFVGPVFSSYTGTEELLTPVCSSEPENLEAASYNRTGLLLTWERPRAVYDSAIERYAVSYEMADAEDAAPSEYLTDGDQDVGAILDDLVANSSYAVRVAAVCANGLYGRVSDPATFTVPADGPENSLIPDSDDFDYAEANYPPDPFSNESVQREDSDQARIPTTSPATSTSGPLRRPLQKPTGATETETQSTTVSATSSQGATSGPPAEVATGFPSTTPLYANASDRAGRVGPKSSESNEVDRTASTATGSDVWMEGGKSVSSSGTTTSSTTNKTRPMTTNQILFTNQVPNSTTKMTANTTADKTVTRPMTETTATNVTTRNTTETLQVTTYRTTEKPTTSPTDKITTTKTTTNESTTAAPTITTNMTTRKTTIETTTVTVTTAGGANTNVNKETRDKSASGPLNATTPTTGTKNTSPNVAHLGDGLIAASSVHLLSAAETEVRRDDAMQVQGELFPELPSPSAAVVSLSEDVSNSSHESRVGSDGDGRRKAAVPLAVISALTALGLALLVGVLLYWRMCFRTAHFYVDEGASPRVAATPAFTPDEKSALPVGDFVKHVAELHRTCGFRRKFEETSRPRLPGPGELVKESSEEVRTCAAMTSDRPDDDGGQKRYGHVPPGDRSRARLSAVDEDAGDDIDANLVDGFKMRHAYIAAQGPSKSSTDRFWRMIWEQNVGVVVMIGDLLEKGRKKCHQYWPADVREDYGGLAVTLESVQERAHYTRRTFAISETHVKKGSRRGRGPERAVTQYHYTRWPDGGVPEDALPLIGFIRETRRARTTEVGPVVVHCSAGVGRTGAYLVLDGMLRQIRLEDAVDVDGFLRRICTQTNCLVQTQEQYVFIHDALAEAISCGDTEVAASRLGAYVERLLTPREDGKTPLDRQLELLSAGAADPANDDLREDRSGGPPSPAERSRVRLSPCAADESGYINASYVTGHERIKEFIITQNPLPGTVKDFWSMIWDQNSGVIVSLPGPALAQDGEDEDRGAEPRVFWPAEGQPMSWERLSVTLTGEDVVRLANGDALNVHRLAVCAAQDDFLLDVRLYRAPRWPNPDGATSDALLLLELLRREEETSPEDGPLVVLDRAGGVTAGTFCALSSLIGQLHGQGRVDVFRVARTTALCRPGTFRTRDQLEFLYKALLSVLDKQQQEEDRPDDDDDDDERTTGAARSLESLV
ncbi:receptor-type tyrosine-protein phosphatase zeta-like isoform X3 [Syngnathoides biaculeatus]|uniref:receptor-type tyrosine-protein phosphatase zeta-like isoform X3 n=1 Tax=Syngnathoides biaculeatus TaxID=300417 RepID=UPI002ADE1623|nr:receptor-type tyrosine-protein phosphatase zeta-like isoform X3 [Syngnathoides biaculeatus]